MRSTGMHAVMSLAAALASPLHAHSLSDLWNASSRLTPAQASEALRRQADGEDVPPTELFEAEKYLRTDGGVSLSFYIVTDVLMRFLDRRIHDRGGHVRLRTFSPVLQWLEARAGSHRLVVRGESQQVAVLNARGNRAVTVLYHQTILQEWRLCGAALCVRRVAGPLHENATYELSTRSASATPGEARFSDLALATDLAGWLHSRAGPAEGGRAPLAVACDPVATAVVISKPPASTISLRHRSRVGHRFGAARQRCPARLATHRPRLT